jgi:TPR repeat protein
MKLQEAHQAYNAKDFTTAFALYTELSQEGNADAQTSLAFMYQNAQACEKNEAKALELYTIAAEAKQPYALFNLAILYENGIGGVAHDQFRAHELHMEAATREVPPAMYEVALMLERGLGCMQNYSEAAFWYEEAAKRGHLEAFNNLGVLYKDGHGVIQDDARCFICFKRAAEGGLAEGLYNLGLLYDQGIGCELNNDTALEYCRKAAYKGHAKAKEIIKGLQEDGKIVF